MNLWPRDNTAACLAFYGDPRGTNGQENPNWKIKNLVHVAFPWHAVASWEKSATVKSAYVHHKCADAFDRVFRHLWELAKHDQHLIESWGLHLYGGAYNFRPKRGLGSLSVHAFGAAIDIDPERNGLGDLTPYMPQIVVDAFKAEGAVWGGDFHSRKDGMHFQFATI